MTRSLNFSQIEAFKAVMHTGTTTRAASVLNTTQPSISRRIAELQAAAGFKLFDLKNGRLRPTTEGRHLYQAVLKHFEGLQKIDSLVAIMRESGTQTLRIGCTPTIAVGILPTVVNLFLKKYPNTHISIQTLSTKQLEDYLNQDLIDFALASGKFGPGEYLCEVLNRTPAVCVLPQDHALAKLKKINLKMLRGERILSFSETDELTVRIKKQLIRTGLPDYFSIQTPSSITVCALVAAGNGVGIVSPYIAAPFSNRLAIVKLDPSIEIEMQVAIPSHTAPSQLVEYFLKILRTKL
jgi:DNA-binding transcriptional LysR family regulator